MKKILLAGALALALLPSASMAQTDQFGAYADNVSAPCRRWVALTPSDTTDLTDLPKAIYVGTGGDISMIGVSAPTGSAGVVWKGVPAASLIPVRPRRILATGTTAADLVGCY